MELPLPDNILNNVKEFSSDKVGIHPTAQLMKNLSFEYKPEEARIGWSIYRAERLRVTTKQGHFTENTVFPHRRISRQSFREFILANFFSGQNTKK
jgi:hypothetical protein